MTGSLKSDYNSSTSSFPSPSKPRQSTLIWPQLPPLACRIQHFSACPAGPLKKSFWSPALSVCHKSARPSLRLSAPFVCLKQTYFHSL